MSLESLDLLLERLSRGDVAAAEQVVADYEPYLRMLVRRALPTALRAKFDSIDVVQSVWVHVLDAVRDGVWEITDRARLRALLVTVARRRLISRYRHHRTALEREQPGGADLEVLPARHQPRPSEVAQAGELWEKMLALCPPEHHELLRLRRQGLLLAEIAARTGMHEGSVRRILRRLARELALEQEPLAAGHGEDSGGLGS
ncbi:MAG TPA: sigma-70 family RNA polymerase sigma factor [Gemmataceae bacterium]|nr:sigma-70 family RNA polymerase sigma factor [Gemmataceae bacterium]